MIEIIVESVVVLVISFLIGSIPWGVVISRIFFKTNIQEYGSGNIGTTNAIRVLGKKGGIAVFVLDFVKGLLAGHLAYVILFYVTSIHYEHNDMLFVSSMLNSVAFFGCICGHVFCPWLHFKGGKGIAVAVGCMFVTFGWQIALIELALFIVIVTVTRYVSLGSIAAALLCVFMSVYRFYFVGMNLFAATIGVVAAIIVIAAHRQNISRLRSGTENRFSFNKEQK